MKISLLPLGILFTIISCTPGGSSDGGGPSVTPGSEVSGSGDDPLAVHAWHLENSAQTGFSLTAGIAGEDQSIHDVINLGIKGDGIRIAVSDSGTEVTHPDLSGNALSSGHRTYAGSTSFSWAPGGNPAPIYHEAHGTAVAGLIAARGWNGIGSRGVAPDANFSSFLFIGASPSDAKTLHQINGDFDIFNYSYGYAGCNFIPTNPTIFSAYKNGVTNLRGGLGAIYVKAAGNDFVGPQSDCYPGAPDEEVYFGNTNTNEDQNNPYVILAAAVNARGRVASYSTPGSGLWVSSAGGEDGRSAPAMISTDITGCSEGMSLAASTLSAFNKGDSSLNLLCNYTSRMNGTSSAAPTLSGIVALMLEANPDLSWRDVKHILAATADKPNFSLTSIVAHPGAATLPASYNYDYRWVKNGADYTFSNTYGFGRANALSAVTMAQTYTTNWGPYLETVNPNNDDWYYDSGVVGAGTIPDYSATGKSSTINVNHNYFVESIQIKLTVDHDFIGDLAVELTSPSNNVSRILLGNSLIDQEDMDDYTLLTNAFYGENSEGNWTLKVIDTAAQDTGTFVNWKIKVNGHTIVGATDTLVPTAPTSIVIPATYISTTASPSISFTGSASGDVMRYEVAIGNGGVADSRAQWFSIGTATTFQVTDMLLVAGQTYRVSIRAIDTSENVSTVITADWQAL